jgi:Tfp pilus assembly protein PilV
MNRHARVAAGSALLEVVLAMALMAMCGLGLLSAQLGIARHALASATRARAAFAVDAMAEAALETGPAARDQWRARAVANVPDARLGESASQIVLSWAAPRDESASDNGCAGAAMTEAGRACVALAVSP